MAFEIIDANAIFGPWPIVRADMPIERLITAMSNHGVSRALAVSTVGALHNHGDGNAETLKLCSEQPALIPVATIDPRGYFGATGMVEKLKEQGFRLLRFFPELQGWSLDHAAFLDILDEASSANMPIMVQTRNTGNPTVMARSLNGRPLITILEGVSFENMAEAVSVMRKNESIITDTRELRVPGALRFLVDQVGADRVVFGSGCLGSSLAAALGYINDAEISDENKAQIFGGNIKRLLTGG